ncbi:MAG: hypothetical protein ACK5UQ_07855, partial [Planctomycetota bacterium]
MRSPTDIVTCGQDQLRRRTCMLTQPTCWSSACHRLAAGCDGVENVAVAALLRQQAERRVRARLRVPHGAGGRRGGRRRCSWAELLQRTFGIEVLV